MNRVLLQECLDTLKYHQEQTRPIHRTIETMALIKAELAKPEQYTLICEKCGADRTKEDCKGERLQCGVMGQAQTAKPEQEPVAWGIETESGEIIDCITPALYLKEPGNYAIPLYTSPPCKEWVDLTNDQMIEIRSAHEPHVFQIMFATEAKLREQNT